MAFKKIRKNAPVFFSNREANTRNLVHRSSIFQPQFHHKKNPKKCTAENRTRADQVRCIRYHYTTTLTTYPTENFYYKIIDLYTVFIIKSDNSRPILQICERFPHSRINFISIHFWTLSKTVSDEQYEITALHNNVLGCVKILVLSVFA